MSDIRTKESVTDFDSGLDAIMRLKTISYQYNGKAGMRNGETHIGISAQDLQKVAPELVQKYVHRELKENQLYDEPFEFTKEEEFLVIKDNEVKYLLINAIQDQQEIIRSLEERIKKLESTTSKSPIKKNSNNN